MKVELTRDVSHLLTKGNRYTARPDIGDQVKITIHAEMTIPAEFYRRVEVITPDGTSLVEGKVYDITYTQEYGAYRGREKTLRGWEFLYETAPSYNSRRECTFLHRGSRYVGRRQQIDLKNIVSATEVAAPGAEKE